MRVDPESRLHQHLDYFGTTVIEFGVSRPHDHLSIDVRARVQDARRPTIRRRRRGPSSRTAPYRVEAGEFVLPDGDEPDDLVLDELVGVSRAETPLATVQRMVEMIPDRFEYRTGVTYVGSTVADLLEAGAGVCQDFAHLALLLLRRHGIAARYVSGYLWAPPNGDETADSAEVETHAWIEALVPGEREPIWVPADPTNRTLGGESHVKIGHGRNYARRAAGQGRLPRRRGRGADGLGADAAHRRLAGPGMRLDHVQVAAPPGCEAEARRFYGDLLGLAEVEKPEPLRSRGGVWFEQLHVGVEEDFAPARKAHPALRVPDLDALAERLAAAGKRVAVGRVAPGRPPLLHRSTPGATASSCWRLSGWSRTVTSASAMAETWESTRSRLPTARRVCAVGSPDSAR